MAFLAFQLVQWQAMKTYNGSKSCGLFTLTHFCFIDGWFRSSRTTLIWCNAHTKTNSFFFYDKIFVRFGFQAYFPNIAIYQAQPVCEMDNIKFKTEEGEFSKRIRPLQEGGW